MVSSLSQQFLRLYGHYQKGFLVWPGGMFDQPAAYVDAMETLQATMNRIQREKLQNG